MKKKEAFVTNEENVMNTSLTGTKILYLDHESRNDCTLPVPQGPGTGCSILTDLPLTARLRINKKVQLHVNIGSEIFLFFIFFCSASRFEQLHISERTHLHYIARVKRKYEHLE